MGGIYFAHFHAHLRYGTILYGGGTERIRVFTLQKTYYVNNQLCRRQACKKHFKKRIKIHIPCIYIIEVICQKKPIIQKLKQNTEICNQRQGISKVESSSVKRILYIYIYIYVYIVTDHLCDLVVPGCRFRGPGSISRATTFSEWAWNGVHSAL
jgi:hypothetical protein